MRLCILFLFKGYNIRQILSIGETLGLNKCWKVHRREINFREVERDDEVIDTMNFYITGYVPYLLYWSLS